MITRTQGTLVHQSRTHMRVRQADVHANAGGVRHIVPGSWCEGGEGRHRVLFFGPLKRHFDSKTVVQDEPKRLDCDRHPNSAEPGDWRVDHPGVPRINSMYVDRRHLCGSSRM